MNSKLLLCTHTQYNTSENLFSQTFLFTKNIKAGKNKKFKMKKKLGYTL